MTQINLRIISKPHAYLQSMVTTSAKFQENRNKTVGGNAHTRYPLPIHFYCQNARKMAVQIAKKVTKKNLRIISKPHAYLQSMVTTSAKFQENRNKTRRSCAHKVPTIYSQELKREITLTEWAPSPLNLPERKIRVLLIFIYKLHTKFQDPSSNGS